MTQYSGLAAIYDQLMQGIDYDDWASYIMQLVRINGGVPHMSALDLACGTGSTTISLAKLGFTVTGLDLSPEMLALAQEKAADLKATYLQGDMRAFSLDDPVGLAISFQDGINYLLTEEDLLKTMEAVYLALLPGALFIFDINRVEKLTGVTSDVTWVDCGEFALVWETHFVTPTIWEIQVTGFAEETKGLFRKFYEVHKERIIPHEEVLAALQYAGFTLMGVYKAFSTDSPDPHTRRVFYTARKL